MNHLPDSVLKAAKTLDHTLLKSSAVSNDIIHLTEQGLDNHVAAICVNPYWVALVSKILQGSDVAACCVVGFPLGANCPEVIAYEASQAVDSGVDEIDMVMNTGLAKEGNWNEIEDNIRIVKNTVGDKILKVIIEICELTDSEINTASLTVMNAGGDFVKTSTGFGKYGATVNAVKIMRKAVGGKIGIKAAGGIKTLDAVLNMIEAGAARIGTSSTLKILEEAKNRFG